MLAKIICFLFGHKKYIWIQHPCPLNEYGCIYRVRYQEFICSRCGKKLL